VNALEIMSFSEFIEKFAQKYLPKAEHGKATLFQVNTKDLDAANF